MCRRRRSARETPRRAPDEPGTPKCTCTFASQGDAQALKLPLDRRGPAAVRERARRARMKNRADGDALARERRTRAAFREAADADDDARPKLEHDGAQSVVARAGERS